MINNVVLVGRMTKDPELRRTASGVAVASFNLAVNRNFTSSDGQEADFIPCVVWNKAAENVEKYCAKGSLVGINGRLQSRTYDNAQGQKVYVVEAVCQSVQFLETKRNELDHEAVHQKAQEYQGVAEAKQNMFNIAEEVNQSFVIDEDDIQF